MYTTINEFGMPINCPDIYDIVKTCIEQDCQREFIITRGELDWLAREGLAEFRRCPECRRKRRDAKRAEQKVSNDEQ